MAYFKTYKTWSIAVILIIAMLLFIQCSKQNTAFGSDEKHTKADTTLTPVMYAYDIQSLVSDSGKLKVRLTSKEYQTYVTDTSSFWIFPSGLFLERFTDNMETDANIICRYAKYYEKKEFWELRDSVVAKNSDNEVFETELLYWNQKSGLVYTDQYVQIIRPGQDTIEGFSGMKSNQSFTKWEIFNTKAQFKMEMED